MTYDRHVWDEPYNYIDVFPSRISVDQQNQRVSNKKSPRGTAQGPAKPSDSGRKKRPRAWQPNWVV